MAGAEGVDTGGRLGGLRSGDDDEDEKRDERQHLTDELDAWVLQDPYHLQNNTKKTTCYGKSDANYLEHVMTNAIHIYSVRKLKTQQEKQYWWKPSGFSSISFTYKVLY